jgi:hypothetical protein
VKRRISRAVIGTVAAFALTIPMLVGIASPAQAAEFNQFVEVHSGKCMTVAGGSQSDNANVTESTCLGFGYQRFRLQSAGDGYFLIVAAHSSKCMGVDGGGAGNGIDVIQFACHGLFNQQWQRVVLSNGHSRFIARHSGRCLEVAGNTNDIQQWGCSSNRKQEWRLA